MNPTFVEGLLIFACLWSPTAACRGGALCNNPAACPGYPYIRFQGAMLTCKRRCYPDQSTSCFVNVWQREPCLIFDEAKLGKCYGGVCYAPEKYDELAAKKAPNTRRQCRHGHDYLTTVELLAATFTALKNLTESLIVLTATLA
ncbi:uncharacterized protein LOC135369289 isoform X2 [Ornithodoros turicata]|uniref:uncharacterized protein LOC135369289 isoform X2 n=1 Tax=Ornithodoros turicata TaxID=34597 RepID=UPI00313A29C4